ncbi:DUF6165 family protein [Azospirillum isscasi]|uniref:DUF6165 family protein n=1 Tax=Azospirillum isscasi TaxID=3053926 RepID=A0ABU0WDE1_9PROT|nr:DUF6165 family protein [Azospirillum isscasi]MDQ2101917.1 DUF6165 family protein [Azospirillum isscasi]
MTLRVPVSWGELIDKITILEIKAERIRDPAKLANIRRELDELCAVRDVSGVDLGAVADTVNALRTVNQTLWDVEDAIRLCERCQDFGPSFIALARDVYFTNDERARLKRVLNDTLGSELVEEKSYA